MLPVVIYLTFFPVFCQEINGEERKNTGYKYFKNYSYLEYDHHPQNWCIIQDQKGVIYVGNLGGVLIYDGVTWKVMEVPNMLVRSMAMAEDGRIYIGGNGEIGYLAPNSRGFLEYVSLKNYFDKQYGNFSDVYDTIATEEGVYFRTRGLLFRWNYKKIDMYKEGIFKSLFLCNGNLLIQQSGVGLMKLEKGSFTPLPGSQIFGDKKIRMMVPYDTGDDPPSFLLGTRAKGLLIYKEGTIAPFATEADDYLQENKISHGIRLSTGNFAVATLYGGMVILDAKGHIKYIFNKIHGLQDKNVKFVLEDNLGNLWLALFRGVSRLEYRSPFYHYDDSSGLEGMALTVVKHKGNLYTGTTQGVYVLYKDAELFHRIAGVRTCWELLSTDESLLAATQIGVYQLDTIDRIPQNLYGHNTFQVAVSRLFPGHIWCASKKGLAALVKKDNRWTVGYKYKEITNDIRNVAEDPAGHLWLVISEGNILKVDFPNGIAHPVVTRFKREGRLHEEEIFMALVEGHVVFASRKGLFRYDKKADTFIPDMVLGQEFASGPRAIPVFRIAQDKNRNIWFHSQSRNYRALPGPGKTFVIEERPFHRIPIIQMNAIYPDPDGRNTWFAGAAGLTRYDNTVKIKWNKDFTALVRRVFVNEKIHIFGGYKDPKKDRASPPLLSYENRDITFHCAAPFFEKESEIIFRYMLDGYSKDWSEWTPETRKHYTNLDAGRYTFRVRAKNIYGVISKEDTFFFRVLPPWYQTWWAFSLYALGLFTGIFLLLNLTVKWRSRKLVREKERLEHVVEERTREIRDKNDQLEQQTLQLKDQSEKLKEMDKVKSRFFANISHEFRTPLTLIMSPLEQLLSRTRDDEQRKSYRMMLRNSQQLLTLINQLLELSRIDSGKMKLQAACQNIVSHLERTLESFRGPAEQRQLTLEFLCEKEDILLYFDTDKMEEVIYNLLSNALKFTPAGGRITISAALEPQYVRISVKDTGIGIPQEQLNKIFDRFYQAGSAGDKTGQGTGIGLALTKELITLHHGRIDVHSSEEKGTEFVVRLPMGKDHLSADEIASAPGTSSQRDRVKEIDTMYVKREDENDSLPTEEKETNGIDGDSNGESQNGEPEKISILVVEDHDDMRRHIRSMLEPQYRIIEAADGKEGIEKAKEFMPDLIVSDIMMPEVDGYQLCRTLKKDIRTSHIPIVMLTAKASEKSVIRGLETGADDYVTKPFNENMLCVRIKNLIDLRRQMQLKIQREKMLLPAEIPVSNQDDLFLKEFQGIIEKNLDDEDFSIDVLSKKLLISRSTLFTKIQALTGETPNQFIQSYRLERGAQLLRENFGNVTEVAMAVGFSTPQYFAKLFKEKFHQSPKAFQASEAKTP
jgi:signal transduction histidine kinase/DNA-binding response OmpR family regulator/ligand-binding sensor domain-containing protein